MKMRFLICRIVLMSLVLAGAVGCSNNPQAASLPQVSISADTSALNFGNYVSGQASFEIDGKIQFNESPIKIKYRGNSSAHYDKKNFSLKLSDSICLEGLTCRKKWKLNAEYVDKTLMRNKLSYDLFRSFSPGNIAPHIQYVEVDFNSTYHGVYALTERIDKELLGLDSKDSNAVIFKDPPISFPTEEHQRRYEDFIAFTNWNAFYKDFSEKAMKKLLREVYYNQRHPNVKRLNKKADIHRLTDFIFYSSDSVFTSEADFGNYFDLQNIIDWHLLLLVTNNEDGLLKNFYLYRQGEDQPFLICPWDYDHSFGRDGDGELNLDSFVESEKVALLNRLLQTNAFGYRKKLLTKFQELQASNLLTADNLVAMIDENALVLGQCLAANTERWPIIDDGYFVGSSFDTELELMKKWVKMRLPKVEEYLNNMQD